MRADFVMRKDRLFEARDAVPHAGKKHRERCTRATSSDDDAIEHGCQPRRVILPAMFRIVSRIGDDPAIGARFGMRAARLSQNAERETFAIWVQVPDVVTLRMAPLIGWRESALCRGRDVPGDVPSTC